MLSFKRARIADYIDSLDDLVRANWDEMASDFGFEVNLNKEAYINLEVAGFMFAIAMLSDDKLVGYATFTVTPHLFNSARIGANTDGIFIAKEHRNATTGGLLLRAVREYARELGAQVVLWHAQPNSVFNNLLARHDDVMELSDLVYREKL